MAESIEQELRAFVRENWRMLALYVVVNAVFWGATYYLVVRVALPEVVKALR